MTHRELPRRTFLRGLGTAIALPVLDAMTSSLFASRASKSSCPARMAFALRSERHRHEELDARKAGD